MPFLIDLVVFVSAAFIIFYFESYLIEEKKKKNSNEIEKEFLLATISFEQYRHQMLEIMSMVYEKAGESDPQFTKDFEKIKESINKKCDERGDLWILNLKNSLGRETKYNNWKEATKYTEGIILKVKNADSRKDNKKND